MKQVVWFTIVCIVIVLVLAFGLDMLLDTNNSNDIFKDTSKVGVSDGDINSAIEFSYNGEVMSFPSSASVLAEDGWYIYFHESNGNLVLLNDKYAGVTVFVKAPNHTSKDLSALSEEVSCVTFEYDMSCKSVPEILVSGSLTFKSSQESVCGVLGTPYRSEEVYMDDILYKFLYFKSETNGTSTDYEVVMADDMLKSITISILPVK